MREINSQIQSRISRLLSILVQYRPSLSTISPLLSTNFSDSKHTSESRYSTFSHIITNTILYSVAFFRACPTVLLGISDSLNLMAATLTRLLSLQTETEVNDLYNELTLRFQFNSFFEEQKSPSSVFVLNSENDQLYHGLGFDSSQIPEELKCPLTDQIFTTPIRPKDSKVEAIELSALQYWFEQKQKANPYQQPTHPMSRHVLDMKNLVIDEKLAKKAKNFVEKKVARIGDLLIYSSRLYSQFEREQCIGLLANYAFLVLELIPPKSFLNLVSSLSLFKMLISHLPAPKKQILKALTMYAQCANFFRESQRIVVRKSKPQNLLAITHQPAL